MLEGGWLKTLFSQFLQHFNIISSVCLRWVAEEQPNPKWKIQLEHFQKAVAGANLSDSSLLKHFDDLFAGQPEHAANGT